MALLIELPHPNPMNKRRVAINWAQVVQLEEIDAGNSLLFFSGGARFAVQRPYSELLEAWTRAVGPAEQSSTFTVPFRDMIIGSPIGTEEREEDESIEDRL